MDFDEQVARRITHAQSGVVMRSGRLCTSVILDFRKAFVAGGHGTVKKTAQSCFSSAQTFKVKLYCGRNVL